MDRLPILSLFSRRSADDFPDKDSPEFHYTEAVLERHKQQGLALAVHVRWVTMFVIGVLLFFIVPMPDVLYYECILALLSLNGWLMRQIGRVGLSRAELGLIFLDLVLMTAGMVGPNPLSTHGWPLAMQYQFDNFIYFYIILAYGTLAYSWRTVLTLGIWTSGIWVIALGLSMWLSQPAPDLTEAIYGALPDMPDLAYRLDPNAYHVSERIQEVIVFLIVALIMALSVRRFNGLLRTNAALERERTNLSRYFSPNVVEELSQNDDPLKQIRSHDIAVLFVDIVGFTKFAANRDPREVIATLREFHGLMEQAVFNHHGTLDKYLGDGLMATFGTPAPGEQDAINALNCVHQMMDALDVWNENRLENLLPALRVGFGIHYGPAVLADIGAHRLEFAVVGNTVNVASRLENLTRDLNARLVISDDVRCEVLKEGGHACLTGLREHKAQSLRGVEGAVDVWVFERPKQLI